MKKGITIVLLILFLLNTLGYYGVFVGLQFRNEKEMKALFDDDNYLPQQEVTIKVPITVPYATDSREFTRVDGEFEHNGEIYRLVKQRLISDTLHIVCVKDNASKEIKQALTDYVKSFSDNPSTEKDTTKSSQQLIKDYISCATLLQSEVTGWGKVLTHGTRITVYESLSIQLNSPPPKA